MEYNAELRRQFKAGARQCIKDSFLPTMGAVVLATVPAGLLSTLYNRMVPSPNAVLAGQAASAMPGTGMIVGLLVLYFAAMLFINEPLQFGLKRYMMARARGQEASVSMVASCLGDGKSYLTAMKTAFAILGRSIPWIILECAAAGAMAGVFVAAVLVLDSGSMAAASLGMMLLVPLMMMAFIAVTAVVSVKVRRFDGAYIRMIDDPSQSAWKAAGECANTFRNHNCELLVFDLSFIGWQVLSAFTMGIAGIYCTAYSEAAFVNYFDALRMNEAYREQQF